MKTGLLGGTFNPIHNGHIELCAYCKNELGLDRVILIPTFTPPHKSSSQLADSSHRLKMCLLAALEYRWLSACDIEIKRGGKSYTYQTLCSLKKLYPDDSLYFITGADMFLTLHTWRNPQIIFDKADIIAVPRENTSRAELMDFYNRTLKPMGARAHILNSFVEQVSSTLIRDNIQNDDLVSKLLNPRVKEYITDNNLYRE